MSELSYNQKDLNKSASFVIHLLITPVKVNHALKGSWKHTYQPYAIDIKHYCAHIVSSYLLLHIDINETTYEFEWYQKNLRLIWMVMVTSTVYNHNCIFRDENNNWREKINVWIKTKKVIKRPKEFSVLWGLWFYYKYLKLECSFINKASIAFMQVYEKTQFSIKKKHDQSKNS